MQGPAGHHAGAFRHGVGNVFFHFINRLAVDQRPDGHALGQAVADLHLIHRLLEFFGKAVVNAVLHVQAVGADAGLPGVAELRGQRPFHGFIKVGIVKDDKRRVAPQLQRHFFDVFRALGHQLAANFGRAGKGEFAHQRVAGQFVADVRRRTGDHVKHPGGDAGPACQFRQRQRGVGRLAGGFEHHGAACRQGWPGLAGDHRRREVPRGDGRRHADRLLNHNQTLICLMARNGVAVDPFPLFGEPLYKGGGIADLAFGFRQRFALLKGHQPGQIVLVSHHQIEPAAQNVGALFGRERAPGGQGAVRGLNRFAGFFGAHFRHVAQGLAVRRVGYGEGVTAVGVAPLTFYISLLAE